MLKQEASVVPSKSISFSTINESRIINNKYTFESSAIQAYLQQCVPSNCFIALVFALLSWTWRIWASNLINFRYSMSAVRETLRLKKKAVFVTNNRFTLQGNILYLLVAKTQKIYQYLTGGTRDELEDSFV